MFQRSLCVLIVLGAAATAVAGPDSESDIGTAYRGPGSYTNSDEAGAPTNRLDLRQSPFLGTFRLAKGGPLDTVSVFQQDDGRYLVVRHKTCLPGGERVVQRGVGHVRRGMLLVDFYESQTLPPLPGVDLTAIVAENGATSTDDGNAEDDAAQSGDSNGLIGALEGGGPNVSEPEQQQAGPDDGVKIMISASVGKDAVNMADDVEIIQHALAERKFLSLAYQDLGKADPILNEGIRRYQIAKVGYRYPDSRVDVDNKTIAALNGAELPDRAYIVYGSVGQDGINNPEDVHIIVTALKAGGYLPMSYAGNGRDATLSSAIRRYQIARAGFRVGDGRVDINHRTLAALNGESFAQAPGAFVDPTNMPLGEPLPGETLPTPEAPTAADEGKIPPGADALTAFLGSILPAVAPGESVAIYALGADRIHGFVNSATCGQEGRWVQDHGTRMMVASATK